MQHLHIFLSSPGDVNRERQLAREVIDQIQSERLYRDRLKLEVVAWDKPGAGTSLSAHLDPQEAINQRLKKPSQCDIVIVILWARMGTLLSEKYRKPDGSRYRSGTEYEFLDALKEAENTGKPEVLVYRRKNPPDVNLADPQRKEKEKQWDLVEEFFAEFRNPDGSYQRFFNEFIEPSDFRDLLEQDLRDLITQYFEAHPPDNIEIPATIKEPKWKDTPFPGLRAFTPDEALIFYGRGREIDELISKLSVSECRLMSVVGASGTGKSSLVAAGLVPALENNTIPGSEDWVWLRFTPGEVGDNPFMALAVAFKTTIEKHGQLPPDMAKAMESDPSKLKELLAVALEGKPEWAELLIFIDQFEEFFRLVNSKYQDAFVDLLESAVKTPRLRTVMTMRADFYHRCLEWPILDGLLAKGLYTLLAPKTGALHEMVIRPAELAGLRFEDGLPDLVLNDTGIEPGALALMAFALSELWQKSKGSDGVLTQAAYKSFNGVHGAIGKRAEDTFNGLIKENEGKRSVYETALASVFRELVEVDERGVATRRRARLSQVIKGTVAKTLVEALTEARLLIGGLGEDKEPIIEVAHEAIFKNWPRIREWIEDTTDDLRLLRQVRLAAADWDENERTEHFLWPHERLLPVSQMLERVHSTLSPTEKEFVRPESERLLEETDKASTTHQQRVKIGDRLAEIGDPRPGVGLREDGLPDIVWCEVPDGEITLEKEAGTFPVYPFYISKYPVTWIQYRCFLTAKDGYKNRRWWEGLAERQNEPGEQCRKLDNHPAENVSWYDAIAYCRWLTTRLGYKIRLPTEWEWQQAATGGHPDNVFPWGAEWDSSRANTSESGLSRSTAVGLYPIGMSPVKALDMSGNLWEWCLNEYHDPDRIDVAGEAEQVLRGGSWYYCQDLARCDLRYHYDPYHRFDYLGFRLVSESTLL